MSIIKRIAVRIRASKREGKHFNTIILSRADALTLIDLFVENSKYTSLSEKCMFKQSLFESMMKGSLIFFDMKISINDGLEPGNLFLAEVSSITSF